MDFRYYSDHNNSSDKKKPLVNKGPESSGPVVGGVSDEGFWTRLLVLFTNCVKSIIQNSAIEILLITGCNGRMNGKVPDIHFV
jgi:hypothetical protein